MGKTTHGLAKTTVDAPETGALAAVPAASLPRLSESWRLACDINRHSAETLAQRRFLLDKLVWFLRQRELPGCGTDEIRQFLHYVSHGHKEQGGRWGNPRMTRPTSARTAKNYHGILRAFFNWLVAEGELTASPMERIPPPVYRASQVQPFTPEQVKALLAATKRSLHPRRDEAICLFLLDTGVRATELCTLHRADVDLHAGRCTVLGKGNKTRVVPFSRDTKRALYNYLREEEYDEQAALFLSDRGVTAGAGLTRTGLRVLIGRLGKSARIESARCSPHTFRHTFAVEFLRAGGNVFTLQQLLGHTHLAMTSKYVAVSQADVEAQHALFSPVARLKGRGK